jgi:hypothetical protein
LIEGAALRLHGETVVVGTTETRQSLQLHHRAREHAMHA